MKTKKILIGAMALLMAAAPMNMLGAPRVGDARVQAAENWSVEYGVSKKMQEVYFEALEGIEFLHKAKYHYYAYDTSVSDTPYRALSQAQTDGFQGCTDDYIGELITGAMVYVYAADYQHQYAPIKNSEEAMARLRQDMNTYLSTNPEKKTGWIYENGAKSFFENGRKKTSAWINDLYYVDAAGKMLRNTRTPDGYRVDIEGKWTKSSWKQDAKGWKYSFDDGFTYRGGWHKIKTQDFHFKPDGYLSVNTWVKDVYVNHNGVILRNVTTPDGYRVGADGRWISFSWQPAGNKWTLKYKDGFMPKNQWQQVKDKWYHFDAQGYMEAGRWIGNYYLGADGAMVVSARTPDGYYVDASGKWDQSKPRQK
ncbi:MAG: hypothetical protein SPL15_03500 [Lachnospiraceae bacterium]|nr:hypothetical protein [Lachnospiraceae bacterium]MDY5742043.1 hypothetical protein [Lachnospiraceae bacterium]